MMILVWKGCAFMDRVREHPLDRIPHQGGPLEWRFPVGQISTMIMWEISSALEQTKAIYRFTEIQGRAIEMNEGYLIPRLALRMTPTPHR